MQHGALAGASFGGDVKMEARDGIGIEMETRHVIECFGPDGELKWREECKNLVHTAGLNDLLDKYFKGSGYTASWFVGLKGAGTIAAGDTLASHAGWTEITGYTGSRKGLVLGTVAAASVDNSASKAAFAINASATIAGAFVCGAATGTSAILYGTADFTTTRAVENGDTLNVTTTLTAATA